MPSDVFTTHDAVGIDPANDGTVLVKFGIQALEVFRLEGMLLRPVWSPTETSDYRGELVVEFPVGHSETIGPGQVSARLVEWRWKQPSPVADDTDPHSLPSIAWTEVDVVCGRPSDL